VVSAKGTHGPQGLSSDSDAWVTHLPSVPIEAVGPDHELDIQSDSSPRSSPPVSPFLAARRGYVSQLASFSFSTFYKQTPVW
jgi:hypothetical protein